MSPCYLLLLGNGVELLPLQPHREKEAPGFEATFMCVWKKECVCVCDRERMCVHERDGEGERERERWGSDSHLEDELKSALIWFLDSLPIILDSLFSHLQEMFIWY